jgi:nucleoside-diphosphate-sugar epimerase
LSGKVLLTGGAGFIGAGLAAALLRDGFTLDIVDNLSRGVNDATFQELLASGRVHFHHVDLLAAGALDDFGHDFDAVIHLAAILGVHNVLERPYQTLRDNMLVHEAAIAFARRQLKLKRLLFTSTSEVYAGSVLYLDPPFPTPEDTPLALPALIEPRTSYMLSKIYGEAMLIHSGLPYTIVRPHNVYGPRMGMSHVIPQLLEKAHKASDGGSIEVFSPDHKRTFCFIDDAVEMLMRLLQTEAARNQVVNLGSEAPEYTMRQVGEIVASAVGKELRLDEKPAAPGSPVRRAPSMARMMALTGYAAQTPLVAGVRQTYAWYSENVFA